MEFPEDPELSPLSPSPLPCWATQALCDLARAETELRRQRERQTSETEAVKRGVDRAVLGARREERRLLERVEQDHRDAQQQLEQLLKENAAAARVSQALLNQRLSKLARLREQIQRSGQQRVLGQDHGPPEQDLLVKGVADLLQPWEISLSLKKVSFKPSSQPNAVSFGDIRVQEHNLSLPGGGCGPQGGLCPLHAGEMECDAGLHRGGGGGGGGAAGEGRSTPDGAGPAGSQTTVTSPTGRLVRKIRISARSDEESGEEQRKLSSSSPSPSSMQPSWPPSRQGERESDRGESSQDEEAESPTSEPPTTGEDTAFLSVPAAPFNNNNADSEGEENLYRVNRHYSPRNPRKTRAMAVASDREHSPSPERGRPSPERGGRQERPRISQRWSTDSRDGDRARARQDSNRGRTYAATTSSPKMTHRDPPPQASQSCLDLTSSRGGRPRPHSRLSQSSDDNTHGCTSGDSGRAPSPTDSLDSCYTFIVSSPRDCGGGGGGGGGRGSLNHNPRLSKSTADLTHSKTRPLVGGGGSNNDCVGVWRVNRSNHKSSSNYSLSSSGKKISTGPCPGYRGGAPGGQQQRQRGNTAAGAGPGGLVPVARSLSMSVIDGGSSSSSSPDHTTRGRRGDRGEPALVEMEEEGELLAFPGGGRGGGGGGHHLVRQFGKQGSGRAELTLPSGVHVTAQGQLFIVDCGNARVQVTDPQGNIMQQVTSPTSDATSRRCRNYFDIAVNAKGLIALSCAAERALLVFNRHGRLLQTFGGAGSGASGSAVNKDDLEAPRGVTVTRLDEFLVADIRKGTLVALKLDTKTGTRLERTVVTGFHRPYLVAACLTSGMVAVSERGNETGREPCVKVLEPGWNTVRVLGVCSGMGPVLVCPWGICIDGDGSVLVADWGEQHRIVCYPAQGVGWPIVTQGLSSPRGLALLPVEGHLVVSDSMHHCIKMYRYK